jgi:hypothetical protein
LVARTVDHDLATDVDSHEDSVVDGADRGKGVQEMPIDRRQVI